MSEGTLYALNLTEDGRILSATKDKYGAEGQPRVEALPTGETDKEKNVANWKYVNDEYVYDPEPEPPEPEPPEPEQYVTYEEMAQAIREGVDG